jgi:hypothetical protein
MPNFICTTCGTQYAESDQPPASCTICEEPRQREVTTRSGFLIDNLFKLLDQCLLPGFDLPSCRSNVKEVRSVHLRKLHLSS